MKKKFYDYHNEWTILEKLKDVLKRNTDALDVQIKENIDWISHSLQVKKADFLSFKSNSFGEGRLIYIFSYWGLNYKDWVMMWDMNSGNTDIDKIHELFYTSPTKRFKNKIVNDFSDIYFRDDIPEKVIEKLQHYIDYEYNPDDEYEELEKESRNTIRIWLRRESNKRHLHKYKKMTQWNRRICKKCGKMKAL